jgi:multiple antibiotic resistance protein
MQEYLQAVITVLSLVNPAICAALFAQIETGRSHSEQAADATKAGLAILMLLALAALFGAQLLHLFGVSLDAFMVAGGAILAWMGFSMLRTERPQNSPSRSAQTEVDTSLAPLVLFAASPGTISGVITISVAHAGSEIPVTALVAVGVAVSITWLVMVVVGRFGGRAGGGGFLRDTLTRFMGLIVVAMGVQFALTGLKSFMAGNA